MGPREEFVLLWMVDHGGRIDVAKDMGRVLDEATRRCANPMNPTRAELDAYKHEVQQRNRDTYTCQEDN